MIAVYPIAPIRRPGAAPNKNDPDPRRPSEGGFFLFIRGAFRKFRAKELAYHPYFYEKQ